MKVATNKAAMITFLVTAWGVIRKILAHPRVTLGATVSRSLESYIQAMQGAEGESIGDIEHETNMHSNKQSMKSCQRKRTMATWELPKQWKKDCKQYTESLKSNSVLAPINKKTGKPWTKMPTNPVLPPLLIICKGNKMTHTHGKGGYKCKNCKDRSCAICRNRCTFVCSTE